MGLPSWCLVRTRALPALRQAGPGLAARAYSSSSSSHASTSTQGLKPKSHHDRLCSERAKTGDNAPLATPVPAKPSKALGTLSVASTASEASSPPTDPRGLARMFMASPIAARYKDKQTALSHHAETAKSLPAMAEFLSSAKQFDATQRRHEAMLRRAATGSLPWAPRGGKKPLQIPVAKEGETLEEASGILEAHPITWLPDPEDLPASSELRYRLSLYEMDQNTIDAVDATRDRLLDLKDLATNQHFVEHVGARIQWDRSLRQADEKLGRGTLVPLDTPLPALDTSTFNASLPLGHQARIWLDSTKRKRKSKMRKHKHRKLMKKMRARKLRQGRI